MNKLKHTGIKISDYPSSVVNNNEYPHKLQYDHYFITYAATYFGASTINKNYKIPLNMLREDQKFYVGLENAKGNWQNLLSIWSGEWYSSDKTESYVSEWDEQERGNLNYISNKYGKKTDNDKIDRIFFIKNAPIPLEAEQADPAPESNKFVNKKYIDDRFNGIRKINVSNETLQIRPYPCVYEYSAMPSSINIEDTLTLEDGRTIKDCIEKNCLIFYIKLPTPTSTTLSVKANNVDTKWGFSGELTQLLSTAKKNADSGLIKCYAEYIDGTFTVHCTNGMNLKPGEGGTLEIETTESISNSSTHEEVPSAKAVYNYVQDNKGIDVGTKDSSFDNDDDTSGFLSGVSKLNFKGALVNVIKKDDGTIDLWINPDNNYGKIDASSTSWTAPTGVAKKYVFDGDSYDIPTTNGSQTSTAICHAVANDPTITLKGKKGNTVNTTFSIDNLTSKIKAVVYNKNGVAKATCTTDVLKSGASTKNENNIKITIGSLKEYTEADAEDGFVPGTVSLSCSVTPDISAIFDEGNTWSMKVFLVNGDSEETLYTSETYYAYTTKAATISANPSVVLKGSATTRWVSGVQYIAKGT